MAPLVGTLEGISEDSLYDCFCDAFSDYVVAISMTMERFRLHLRRNGYDPAISTGILEDGRLLGFALFGRRMVSGTDVAYDLGTGIRSSCRGRGLAKMMLAHLTDVARERGIRKLQLEVIQENTRALELYRKAGFTISRSFSCYEHEGPVDEPACMPGQAFSFHGLECDLYDLFLDSMHSWQNSRQAVEACSEDFISLVADDHGVVVAHGVLMPASGDVPSLAVDPHYRHRGIATHMLSLMSRMSTSGRLRIINVEDGSSLQGLVENLGFRLFARQYEMTKAL